MNKLIHQIREDVIAQSKFERNIGPIIFAAILFGVLFGVLRGVHIDIVQLWAAPSSAAGVVGFLSLTVFLLRKCTSPKEVFLTRYLVGVFLLLNLVFARDLWLSQPEFPKMISDVGHRNDDIRCLLYASFVSSMVMVTFMLLNFASGATPTHRRRFMTIVMGASAGLFEQIIHCPFENMGHIVVAHSGLVLINVAMVYCFDKMLLRRWLHRLG